MMRNRILKFFVVAIVALLGTGLAVGNSLDDKIRAAQSDVKVFCLVTVADDIQWSALLYLNQNFGAEIYIGILHPSPEFGCVTYSDQSGQIHISPIGRPHGMDDTTLVDSIVHCLFNGGYPDIAIIAPAITSDTTSLLAILRTMQSASQNDTLALTRLEQIFVRGRRRNGAVILDDAELFQKYANKLREIASSIDFVSTIKYKPERFRWYYRTDQSNPATEGNDFLAGISSFRLPEIIRDNVFNGPERKNLLDCLDKYRSDIRASQDSRLAGPEKLRHILSAYGEITRFVQMLENGTGNLTQSRVMYRARLVKYKMSRVVSNAVGIDWSGHLLLRDTPFGKSGKLLLEMRLSGALPVELSYFKFHPNDSPPIIIDSVSTIVQPHQQLYREYTINTDKIPFDEIQTDSAQFSVDLIVEGLTMNLSVSCAEWGNKAISLEWLPGYAILSPFQEGDITSLAQTFDWQLMITKPYDKKLKARLLIDTPDAIVVGSYRKDIVIPEGVTTKYIDIFLAAGRSIGYKKDKVTARLMSGKKVLATTSADVRIVRSKVPKTRDIAFVPDSSGKLEDFLRMANVSFKPFTKHSLIRATLDAYDLIIVGENATDYYSTLRSANSRLRQFVKNGGEVLILGQSFAWPYDIFETPMYAARNNEIAQSVVKKPNHFLLSKPYSISMTPLLKRINRSYAGWSVLMEGGQNIISAGQKGSYLQIIKVGDGHIIYCGLPLLDMAAELDIDAIHLLTNLLNFGHGNK